ncbi:MAG: hypothetical protein A3D10_07480 [Omnitrophica WOR_2 bacterium RIFCSPHIGHO2_02_FULL_48_11]|nr:MAG: hypothetical protein A3D10_07480 [Omnitrophica WOR_2 bacterium RIFCSPHIGHO2_02_FULL_48_11]
MANSNKIGFSLIILGLFFIAEALTSSYVTPSLDKCRELADIVFVGTVMSIEEFTVEKTSPYMPDTAENVKFKISTGYKNVSSDTILIRNVMIGGWGFNFEKDKEYLVFADFQDDGSYNVGVNSGTKLSSQATEDIAALKLILMKK